LHLAEAFMDLLEAFAHGAEGLAQTPLKRALQLFIDGLPHEFEPTRIIPLNCLKAGSDLPSKQLHIRALRERSLGDSHLKRISQGSNRRCVFLPCSAGQLRGFFAVAGHFLANGSIGTIETPLERFDPKPQRFGCTITADSEMKHGEQHDRNGNQPDEE
jgi:hypothetical protein